MDNFYLLSGSLFVMLLVVWRMLTGSLREQRHEQLYADKLSGAEFAEAAGEEECYAGAQFRVCPRPCKPAMAMRGQTFLSDAVPRLPLAGCDRKCLCLMESVDDRRVSDERRIQREDIVEFAKPNLDAGRSGKDRRRKKKRTPYVELSS
jgi:hypothetical protein